ncbi:MAG: glycosyltransferase [Pseudomonadota bacterium]
MVLSPGADRLHLEDDHDLFFFSAAQLRDLTILASVPDWREKSRFAVCWLQEIWARDISDRNHLFDILNQFDHVICPFYHSLEPLRNRLSVPVTYLPWGVDAELFCPYPNPPERVIDVAGIGVVPKATEQALIRYTDEIGGFFHYQTVFGPSEARSHSDHRHNYAGLLKRSKYFLCYAAKFTNAERGRQVEFGLRYVEGVAAGTVMLGDAIDNPAYREWFGWPDAVIPLSPDATDPAALIRQLEREPERMAAVRRANLTAALTRLDNLYRWRDVLKLAGLPETPGMQARQARLHSLAEQVRTASLDMQVEELPRPEAALRH